MQARSRLVAILDAGSQYGKRFDRTLRALNVESVLLPLDAPVEQLRSFQAIIITGSPGSVLAADAPRMASGAFEVGVPMLGVCYGMQLMNWTFGGRVVARDRTDGQFEVELDCSCALFEGLASRERVLLTHGDAVATKEDVADGFVCRGTTKDGVVVALEREHLFGVQFHPEVDLTDNGVRILSNFLFNIARVEPSYTPECRESAAIEYIRSVVGDRRVLSLVSGGVDSSVCSALLVRAIGSDRVTAVHVDNGFMREKESITVKEALEGVGVKIHLVDASQRFLDAVARTSDPEEKRKAIGDTFIRVANDTATELGLNVNEFVLAQGTLRPDLIESASSIASSCASAIKTHHNDTDMVRKLRDLGRVVEPLQDYHKDEVRELGTRLGLPASLVWRQPFPGPGLAIRVLRDAPAPSGQDMHVIESGVSALALGPEYTLAPIPVRSVGVQGDGRTYAFAMGMQHASYDGTCASLAWPAMMRTAQSITSACSNINRVVFAFTRLDLRFKSTPTDVGAQSVSLIRAADHIVNTVLLQRDLVRELAQMPVVLLPARLHESDSQDRMVVLRPFLTNDFMTGVPAVPGSRHMPFDALDEIVGRLYALPWVSCVLYDLTSKPPGTTEWE